MLQKPHMFGSIVALLCGIGCQSAVAQVPQTEWIASWGTASFAQVASQIGQGSGNFTYVNIAHISAGGSKLRLRLTNEFGTANLAISSVQIAPATLSGGVWTLGAVTDVTFPGSAPQSVLVPEGGFSLSDPIAFNASPFSNIAVSVTVPAQTISRASCHPNGQTTSYLYANTAGIPQSANGSSVQTWCYLDSIEVQGTNPGNSIVALGDSITAGFESNLDGNDRYTDSLATAIQNTYGISNIGVLNEGIVANQLVGNASYNGYGPVGEARMIDDVLAQTGVTAAIVLEGINDLGYCPATPGANAAMAQQLIAAYQQVVAQAHAHGILVFGGTLSPVGGNGYYSNYNDAGRVTVNNWIRTSGAFDGVIDFDNLLANNSVSPPALQKKYDSGDHLHPNYAGYSLMGQLAAQSLFGGSPPLVSNKK